MADGSSPPAKPTGQCLRRPTRCASQTAAADGPFAETREYLGGYYILDLPDLDTAIDWAARCPGARAWRVEVRPIQEFGLS